MGGVSTEREVSLKTGQTMYTSIDRNKYDVEKIVLNTKKDVFEKCGDIDFALIALHGKYGEDGEIQSILNSMGIPYSGSDVKSSAVAMDKDLSKMILKSGGVTLADWVIAKSKQDIIDKVIPFLHEKGKVVVKPNCGGSSVMTFICTTDKEVTNAVGKALTVDSEVMVEEFIQGTEITVPILDGRILPTILITSPEGFFDYTAKYEDVSKGGAKEEVVELESELQEKVNEAAMKTFNLLKCKVYGRVDILVRDGVPYVLEINTLPGMTETSLIPRSAASVGIHYPELIDIIIQASLRERAKEENIQPPL